MELTNRWRMLACAFAIAWVTGGCAISEDGGMKGIGRSSEQALIGGTPAPEAALDAVGSIATIGVGQRLLVCTGVLVGRSTVLTTAWCAEFVADFTGDRGKLSQQAFFAVGSDLDTTKRMVEIVGVERLGDSKRVGIFHLDQPIIDVEPARVAALEQDAVGQVFRIVGCGRNADPDYGERRSGSVHIAAQRGSFYQHVFGSFEAFYPWFLGVPFPTDCGSATPADPSACGLSFDWARKVYDEPLELRGEVELGRAPSDVRPCRGDEGAPLLRETASGLTVHGLYEYGVSQSRVAPDGLCELGAKALALDEALVALVARAAGWEDPCGEIGEAGVCEGDTARRCTSPSDEKRELLSLDCRLLGLTCQLQPHGAAGCARPR